MTISCCFGGEIVSPFSVSKSRVVLRSSRTSACAAHRDLPARSCAGRWSVY